jgi:hypothetical protein
MSALGQKQTYAVHKPMSALPLTTTAKADFPQQVMSALPPNADMGHSILMGGVNHFYFFILLRPPKKPPIVAPAHVPNATLTNRPTTISNREVVGRTILRERAQQKVKRMRCRP